MQLLVTALMIEAQSLRDVLGLAGVGGEPVPVFTGENRVLVVTGSGAQRAAAVTGWALGRFPDTSNAINIGFAGAASRIAALHTWHRINSIRDCVSGRLHIPDILDAHSLPEAALFTVPKAVTRDNGFDGLVDMEGSGFYEAARLRLSPDRIQLLKWVSDALVDQLNPDEIRRHYEKSLDGILPYLTIPQSEVISVCEPELLGLVRGRLRLTRTQDNFLSKWIRGYLLRGGSPDAVISLLPELPPNTKVDNKNHFEALKDVLKS